MRDIATATLSGNLTREVELHELPSGSEVARLPVASTARRRSGEEWVDTNELLYGGGVRRAGSPMRAVPREVLAVIVDAELDWREWTDDEHHRREVVTLRARRVLFEGVRARNGRGDDPDADASPRDTEPVAATPGGEGSASTDALPF
jgi:single-stranded DNA-binding protein